MNTFWKLWKSKAQPNGEVTFPVRYVTYNLTAGHPVMRVMYFVTRRAWVADWIDFEGSARPRAIHWWQQRSHAPVPATAAEAVELANNGALAKTRAITLRQDPDESDPRIVGYKFGPILDYPAVPQSAPNNRRRKVNFPAPQPNFWRLWKSRPHLDREATYPVRYVMYKLTAGHPRLHVMYFLTRRAWVTEWLDFEGRARPEAMRWWQQRSHSPVPATAAEAVALANNGALATVQAITMRQAPGESWPRIVGYTFGPIPDYPAVPQSAPNNRRRRRPTKSARSRQPSR